MKSASPPRSGAREAPQSAKETDMKDKQTPNTDMQPDDAGTPESGNDARGSAAEGAMKQTSKTDAERSGGR
jgi:hypothetical protein